METDLGGVYGDAGGVYGNQEGGEILQENMSKSYREIISEICTDIDRNLAYINEKTEAMKGWDQNRYITLRKEFLEVGNQYKFDLTEAMTTGEQSPAGDKQRYINNMKTILDYTNQSVGNIKKLYEAAPPTDNANRGVNPTMTMGAVKRGKKTVGGNLTNLGQYRTTGGNMGEIVPQQIVMTNVGPIRAWWDGVNPNIRTFVKIGAMAAAIFAGEYLYKKYKTSKGTTEEE